MGAEVRLAQRSGRLVAGEPIARTLDAALQKQAEHPDPRRQVPEQAVVVAGFDDERLRAGGRHGTDPRVACVGNCPAALEKLRRADDPLGAHDGVLVLPALQVPSAIAGEAERGPAQAGNPLPP